MSEDYKDNPNIHNIFSGNVPKKEELSGAVDLASPDRKVITSFQQTLDEGGGAVGIVLIGMTKNGRIFANHMSPGGLVMLLGMIEAAKGAIMGQQQQQPQPPAI